MFIFSYKMLWGHGSFSVDQSHSACMSTKVQKVEKVSRLERTKNSLVTKEWWIASCTMLGITHSMYLYQSFAGLQDAKM